MTKHISQHLTSYGRVSRHKSKKTEGGSKEMEIQASLKALEERYKVKFIYKEKSTLCRILNLLIFSWFYGIPNLFRKNKLNFMTDFLSVIGTTNVYLPAGFIYNENDPECVAVVIHEVVHVLQFRRNGLLVGCLSYSFPFPLLLLVPFSFLNPIFLIGLIGLVPIAPWRMRWEMEAVAVQSFVIATIRKSYPTITFRSMVESFPVWAYWMYYPTSWRIRIGEPYVIILQILRVIYSTGGSDYDIN